MIKMTIGGEEVVCNKEFTIKEEMLSTSSTILNNCYPKTWEQDHDYVSRFYYPKDYSECLIKDITNIPAEVGEYATGTNLNINVDNTKEWSYQLEGDTQQNTSILPSGYTQVDYIEGHRAEYIDTGFKATPKTRVEATFQFTQVTPVQQRIFGNGYRETDGLIFTTYINGGGNFAWACQNNAGNWQNTGITANTNKHTFIVDSLNNSVSIDNYNATITSTRTNNSVNTMLLFTYRDAEGMAVGALSYLKMYSTKIYDNNVLVRDFIPCYRNSDNVVGMYDLVNNVFYTNQGTGAFTYGSAVDIPNPDYPQDIEVVTGEQNIVIRKSALPIEYTQVDYIESSGTQYIDSGILPSENIGFEIDFTPHNDMNRTTAKTIFGSRTTWKSNGYQLTTYTEGTLNGGHFLFGTNDTASLIRHSAYMQKDVRCKISFLNGVFKAANGNETNIQGTVSNVNKNIYLFGCIERINLIELSATTLYNLKFYDNGNLIRNFIPCYRNSDKEVGLYDIVNDVFYINEGTGTFTYGYEENNSSNDNKQVYPINLGNIELCKIGDYQDYIYNQNGDWYLHKEIGKVILNGGSNESYSYQNSHRFWLRRSYWTDETVPKNPPNTSTKIGLFCNRFVEKTANETYSRLEGISYDNPNTADEPIGSTFTIACNSVATNETNFKNWLSNNPLEVVYILQNPQDTQITDTTLIQQLDNLKNATLFNGVNNISVEGNLPAMLNLHYNFVTPSTIEKLLFAGMVKNSGNISLNPRYPKYCALEILDFKDFLSTGETLDFVINEKTVQEAIEMVVNAVSQYGFVLGNVNILNPNDVIGAYSTQNKSAYDVLQYLADISQSRWTTRMIDENTIAIDFYDPTLMPSGIDIDYTKEWWCQNKVIDLTWNYGTRDYRNKQVMLSDKVFAGTDYNETIIADGYNTSFMTTSEIGLLKSILVNGESVSFATNEDKEIGIDAEFYYTPGENTITTDNSYSSGTPIVVTYTPLVKGREVVYNTDEVNRINLNTGRKGVIARYEQRNDVLSSDELEMIGQTYLKYKGSAEVILTLKTQEDIYNIGQTVYFNAPIQELATSYMVKKKSTEIIATTNTVFYTYELTSSFNSETAINWFDNQRNKATGNIAVGEYITRNYDIENTANIIWDNLTITEVNVTGINVLNAPLNSPFVE